jgi:Skp family chaperone for outer membrane proteins
MNRISLVAVLVGTLAGAPAFAQTPNAPAAGAPTKAPAAQSQTPPLPTAPAQPKPPAPPPFPAGAKIGFVNMQLVVAESKLGKSGQDRMKKLHDDNQTNLAKLAKAVQDQQQKITTQTGVVSDTALQAMRRDLDGMQLNLQTEQQKAQTAEQNLNEDLLTDFSQKAMPIIDALRQEKDLWVILGVQDTGDQAGASQLVVVSVNAGLDLSLEIVKRLDDKYPG